MTEQANEYNGDPIINVEGKVLIGAISNNLPNILKQEEAKRNMFLKGICFGILTGFPIGACIAIFFMIYFKY